MIRFSTGPWTPWKLCTCSRGQRMRLTWALHSVLIHKNLKEKPGARFFSYPPLAALLPRFLVFSLDVAHVVQDPYLQHLFFCFFILPAVMTRVLTRWLSVFWWDFRRSWKVLRREQCSVWEDRWTSSYNRPWTLKIWADSFLDGNPGCDLEGSSMLLEETYSFAESVLTFQIGISQLKLISGATMKPYTH